MRSTHLVLSNHIILSAIRRHLSQIHWVRFLLLICNNKTGNRRLGYRLGLDQYLAKLQNPLIDEWDYDEAMNIVTI